MFWSTLLELTISRNIGVKSTMEYLGLNSTGLTRVNPWPWWWDRKWWLNHLIEASKIHEFDVFAVQLYHRLRVGSELDLQINFWKYLGPDKGVLTKILYCYRQVFLLQLCHPNPVRDRRRDFCKTDFHQRKKTMIKVLKVSLLSA